MNMPEHSQEIIPQTVLTPEQYIASMQEQIEMANLALKEAAANHPEDLQIIATDKINELNEVWPYRGHTFLVAGKWSIGKQEYNATDQSVRFWADKEEVLQTATSEGFCVEYDADTEAYRMHFYFGVESFGADISKSLVRGLTVASAAPEEIALSYADQLLNEEDIINIPSRILEKADLNESLHRLYLNHSNFFKLPQKRQQKLMDGLVSDINSDLVNAPLQFGIEVNASKVYTHDKKEIGKLEKITPREGKKHVKVRGQLAGIALFNHAVYDKQRVSSKEQLIDDAAGLCYEIVHIKHHGHKKPHKNNITRVALNDISELSISVFNK